MAVWDAIVVGMGGLGTVLTHDLAQRGLQVMGIDRFAPGHDRGSSHGATRVIRQAYFEHPDYVPLLRRAYERWADLEAGRAESLYVPVGVLEIGPHDGMVVPGVLQAAAAHQLRVEALDAHQLARRFPEFPGHRPPWWGCLSRMGAIYESKNAFERGPTRLCLQVPPSTWAPPYWAGEKEEENSRSKPTRVYIEPNVWLSAQVHGRPNCYLPPSPSP